MGYVGAAPVGVERGGMMDKEERGGGDGKFISRWKVKRVTPICSFALYSSLC